MIERVRSYRITEEIGSGGMAVVYKGVQESLQRVVAIKALKTSMSSDENVVARFEREALSVASFQHENIITLYDYFRERGALFMVMEFVEGIDLYDLIERCNKIPTDVASIITLSVARALDYAHFRGVIHRDVKPANIIISKAGEVKLTDFGIARTEESDLTEAGIGLGTPAYMSPEQIIGDKLDHRSDIWSLGVVLYQMVTGSKPFVEDSQRSVMQRIRLEEPDPPRKTNPRVPRDLERIIFKCMAKSADDRYDSTQDLVIALEQYLAVHVKQNYRARMVVYLKDEELLSNDETVATLHPALIGHEYAGGRFRLRRSRNLKLPLAIALLGIAGGAALGMFVGRMDKRAGAQSDPNLTRVQVCADVKTPAKKGLLQVLAQPWAHVAINGEQRETTPHPPIALEPGRYTVTLTNPYGFEQIETEVTIESGKLATITRVLERANTPATKATKRAAKGRPPR